MPHRSDQVRSGVRFAPIDRLLELPIESQADTLVPWLYLAIHPAVLYSAVDLEFARTAYAEEQIMVPQMVNGLSVGLDSSDSCGQARVLAQKLADGLGEIDTARARSAPSINC
jgi:hypothetical protein